MDFLLYVVSVNFFLFFFVCVFRSQSVRDCFAEFIVIFETLRKTGRRYIHEKRRSPAISLRATKIVRLLKHRVWLVIIQVGREVTSGNLSARLATTSS